MSDLSNCRAHFSNAFQGLKFSVAHHLQAGKAGKTGVVVGDDGDGVGKGGGGDPKIVGSNLLVDGAKMLAVDGVMIGGSLVHRQDVESHEHGRTGRMVNVAKSFGKFACHGPGKAGADGRISLEKLMSLPRSASQFPLQVN